jgi:hypothetical protein
MMTIHINMGWVTGFEDYGIILKKKNTHTHPQINRPYNQQLVFENCRLLSSK